MSEFDLRSLGIDVEVDGDGMENLLNVAPVFERSRLDSHVWGLNERL